MVLDLADNQMEKNMDRKWTTGIIWCFAACRVTVPITSCAFVGVPIITDCTLLGSTLQSPYAP